MMADEPPRVTLIDFGLSKALLEEGDEEAFPLLATSVGKTFVGTPCYLAPEIEAIHQGGADAPRSYGVAVDAWSLGAVVNVTLVARFPEFEAKFGQVARQGRHGGVPRRLAGSAGPRR